MCMLTQCVRMTGNFFFEFEKKNLLIASKAPQCAGAPGAPGAPGHEQNQGIPPHPRRDTVGQIGGQEDIIVFRFSTPSLVLY